MDDPKWGHLKEAGRELTSREASEGSPSEADGDPPVASSDAGGSASATPEANGDPPAAFLVATFWRWLVGDVLPV